MAADPQAQQPPTAGAAVRFPFPPLLFAVPLALALAADRWVLRLPLPGAGRRGTRAAGAAVTTGGALISLSGVLTVLRQGTTVVPKYPGWGQEIDNRREKMFKGEQPIAAALQEAQVGRLRRARIARGL